VLGMAQDGPYGATGRETGQVPRKTRLQRKAMGPSWDFPAEGSPIAQFRQRQAEKEVCGFAGLHLMHMLWNRGVREMAANLVAACPAGLQVCTLLMVRIA